MGSDLNRPNPEDIAFAAVYAGAVGSGAIALLFLFLDVLAGQPLRTPSLLGSALFLGAPVAESAPVRLDLIAAFSLVHFTAFAVVGALFAMIAARVSGLRERPMGLGYAIFALLSVGVALVDQLLPGPVFETIGVGAVLLGNAVAAVTMTYLYKVAFAGGGAEAFSPEQIVNR